MRLDATTRLLESLQQVEIELPLPRRPERARAQGQHRRRDLEASAGLTSSPSATRQSDVPLFDVAGTSVAVNADQHVASLATASDQGDNLYEAYLLGTLARVEARA